MSQRTPAQIEASRINGRRSLGPTTADGKKRSAQNSTKHGLTARDMTIPGEDEAHCEEFISGCVELYRPVGVIEAESVRKIAILSWRLGRADRFEAGALRTMITRQRERDDPADERHDPDDLGDAFIELD